MAETVRIEIPVEVQDETDPGLSDIAKGFDKVKQAANAAKAAAKDADTTVSRFDKSAEKTQKSLLSWAKQKYQLLIEAKDRATPVLSKLKTGLGTIAGKTWKVTMKAVDLVTLPIRGIINLLRNPLFQVGAVLGVSVGLGDTVSTFADFEAAMSKVSAISGATGADLDKLTQKAKDLGATTKFTASEAAEGFNYMAMAGWKTQDMLDGISGVLSLAAASGEDLGVVSDIVTDALTAFRLGADQSSRFADVLAATASSANTTVSGMGETFKYVGTMAGSLGYQIEDVSLAIGLMANSGLKGTMAGTSLNSIMTRLSTNTSGALDAVRALGVEFYNSDGTARDLSDVMGELRKATAGMSAEQKSAFANTVAGMEAQKGLLAILNASEKDYNDLASAIGNADGAAEHMADTMMDNLQGSLTLLQSAADGVKISFGERLKPYIKGLADWLTDQMPGIEAGLNEFMDAVDTKVDALKRKIADFTSTDEWKGADIFGKIGIAWDEIIAKPFATWWDSTGRAYFAEKAGNIGKGLGTAISTGLLTLLGIDVAGAIDDGGSVGAAFAKGFIDGFDMDALKEKIWSAIGGIFSNAGKILPGGAPADLSSWLSAGMIAKVASPLIGLGTKGISLGKSLFGGLGGSTIPDVVGETSKTLLGGGLLSRVIGSTGNQMVQGSGLLNMLANAGYSLSGGAASAGGYFGAGTALSGGAAAALGTAGIAGGLIGGVGLFQGGKDVYSAIKADNSNDRKFYGTRGATKIGMVGLGAAIGSVIPGVGTAIGALIGAGVGGLGAIFGGNKLADKISGVSSETEKLKTRAQELSEVTSEMVDQNLASHFGKISLSLADVKQVAASIISTPTMEYMDDFANALDTLDTMESSLSAKSSSISKYMWKVSVGVELSETELTQLEETLDSYAQEAIDYVHEQNYTADLAIDLLITNDADNAELKGQIDSYYQGISTELDTLKTQLNQAFQNAISIDGDGGAKITVDETAIITDLQQQIASITEKLSKSQFEAKMDVLQFKFSGADLDAESFAALQAQLQQEVKDATAGYDEALEVGIANAKLMLEDSAIDTTQYNEMVQNLKESYLQNVGDIELRAASFQLDTLMEQYDEELKASGLDEKIPETIKELLSKSAEALKENSSNIGLNEALADIWSEENIRSMLGVDKIEPDVARAFSELFEKLAPTEESLQQLAGKYKDLGVKIPEEVANSLNEAMASADMIGAISGNADAMWGLVADEINASADRTIGSGEAFQGMLDTLQQAGGQIPQALSDGLLNNIDLADESTKAFGNTYASKLIENSLNGIAGSGETIGSAVASEVNAGISNAAGSITAGIEVPVTVSTNIKDGESNITETVKSLSTTANTGLNNDFSTVGSGAGFDVAALVGSNIGSNASNVMAGCNAVRNAAASYLSAPINVRTKANLMIDWNVINPTPPISTSLYASKSIFKHAEGGFMTSPHIGLVAEDGAESIIPLSTKRRSRALELWERTGEILGVKKYAQGAILGSPAVASYTPETMSALNTIGSLIQNAPVTYSEQIAGTDDDIVSVGAVPVQTSQSAETGTKTSVSVNVQLTPTFQVSGDNMDEEGVVRVVRAHLRDMADEIGGEIADKLEAVFSNMPLKEA